MKDCPNEGLWVPSLIFYAHRSLKNDTPLVTYYKLFVCDEHKKTMRVEDVLTNEAWNKIAKTLQIMNRAVPDRSRTKINFCPPNEVPTDFLNR